MSKKVNKPDVDLFIKEYILTGCNNGRQACIKAGYSEKTADQQASRLLKNVKVIAAIDEYKKKELEVYVWTKQDKLLKLEEMMGVALEKDPEKGMINMPSFVAALKVHNEMQGDNAPTETNNTHTIKSFSDMYGDS
jgi:hypothetical protein